MNSTVAEGIWKQLRGSVKSHWGRLTDDDLTEINGDIERLVGKLQQLYGETKEAVSEKLSDLIEKARDAVDEFRRRETTDAPHL